MSAPTPEQLATHARMERQFEFLRRREKAGGQKPRPRNKR